ncbi:MAG TPA: UvrD-helicase domain-containing protein [Acidimicrobiales bacterium]|nr:UvrD-helicase domain-containing protein [Acidimicrobiales bacterium]
MTLDGFADADARVAVRTRLDDTLFVEAGAGTGKTAELVQRVVALVRERGRSLARIAAITFTEKAAAELRDRIRQALERAAAAGDERCRAAVEEIDEAPIQTLHAFAQRILAAHPLPAGLPPGFEVLGDTEAGVAFAERWAAALDDLLADPSAEPVVGPAFALGLTPAHLRALAWELHRQWDRLDGISWPAVAVRTPVDVAPVLAALDAAVGAAPGCTDADDRLLGHLEGTVLPYRDLLARMAATGDELEVLAVLGDPVRLVAPRLGRAPNWLDVDDVRARCAAAEDARAAVVRRVQAEVLPPLLERLRRFTLEAAAARRRDGRVEFHDLLVLARDVLRARPDVRRAVRAELDHLLVDEFQDTDPLQVEIAVALAAAGDEGADLPPWHEAPLEPGRLFFVGDPKQSIYRFRRADILLYQQVQQAAEADGGLVRLSQNFRSTAPVLAWVNHVFGRLIGEGAAAGQPAYVPLAASRPAAPSGPGVALLGAPSEAADAEAVRELEASEVAAVLARARHEGWVVGDRPARYADIAVLLPTRTALPALERALDAAGIPFRIESRSLVWSTDEVRELLAVLRAVDDPTDQVALLAALRTPALGCADDDLLAFRLAGGRWDIRRPAADGLPVDHPVLAAMAALRGWWERRWWLSVDALVAEVVRDRRLLELAFAHRRRRETWQRLRFVVDQARAYVEGGGATLRGFVTWADRQADEHAALVETVVAEPDDDAVRVMTVHAAKGLEFGIVVLAGLHGGDGPTPGAQLLWGDDGRPVVRVGRAGAGWAVGDLAEVAAHEDALEALEATRLLYVAATRARDHLVVSLHHRQGTTCAAADLWAHAADADHLATRLVSLAPPDPSGEQPLALTPAPPPADIVQRWERARDEAVAARGRFPSLAATEAARRLAGAEAADEEPEKDEPEADAPPWQRGRVGTAFGRAVHAVLQTVDLVTGDGVDGAARAQAAAEGIPGRAPDVAHAVRTALRSQAAREAAASRSWREVYVAADIDGTVVEGFVDLLYEGDDGLVVVDWKTDSVRSAADVDAAVVRYRPQAAAYALAVERALGRPVARCELVFTGTGEPQQRRVPDLDGARAEISALVTTGERR